MGVISNGTTLLDAGALDSGVPTGKLTLIKTLTASSSSTLSFIDGAASVVLDDTYGVYIIKFIKQHDQFNNCETFTQTKLISLKIPAGIKSPYTFRSSAWLRWRVCARGSAP